MPRPPHLEAVPHETALHGHVLSDPYHWLNQRDNPSVWKHLKAENRYTHAVMKNTKGLRRELFEEMRGRIREDDLTVPERIGDFFYYYRMEKGREYPVYCRRRKRMSAPEEILLNANTLARGHAHFRIGAFRISPSHRKLAYTVDTTGRESFTLFIKDLDTGRLYGDRIEFISWWLEWANDDRTLYYIRCDAAHRPFQVYRHEGGTDPSGDVLVYHEKDPAFYLSLSKTRSRRYLLVRAESMVASEVRFLDADRPRPRFKTIQRRRKNVEYAVEHRGDDFLILTNKDALNFKVVTAPVAGPGRRHWKDLIPHRPDVFLERIDVFKDFMVLHEREKGFRGLFVRSFKSGRTHRVRLPETVHAVVPVSNPEFEIDTYRFIYSSLVTPSMVVDYDMRRRQRSVVKKEEVRGGYRPALYRTRCAYATAPDGQRIPISLVYRAARGPSKPRPLVLYGYGAYGMCVEPVFASARLSLLDRGVIFANAHVRGGAELGRGWYEDGRMLNKMNSFTDFIACAEHLIQTRLTTPEQLAISGGSAGGLLVGAVINMRPDLFQAVVSTVPFVDLMNTMLNPNLPLTVIEYDQWGDPRGRKHFNVMMKYAPYENIREQAYPHVLATVGWNDPRVPYWEGAKWVASLRCHSSSDKPVLLRAHLAVGHGGVSGRYEALKERAFDYAFILDRLGVT